VPLAILNAAIVLVVFIALEAFVVFIVALTTSATIAPSPTVVV
jgi:hypothetical protein